MSGSAEAKKKKKRRRWLKEFSIYVALFGVPLLLFFPYWPWRHDAEFIASIHADAVTFEIGGDQGNEGFRAPLVNATVEGADRIEVAGGSAQRCQTLTLTRASLSSFLLIAKTRVNIESTPVQRNGITVRLQYPADLQQAPVQFFLGEGSVMQCDGATLSPDLPGPIKAFPRDAGLVLGLVPTPPGTAKPGAGNAPVASVQLSSARFPSLARSSRLAFEDKTGWNSIHAFAENVLEVVNAKRPERIGARVLTIDQLSETTTVQVAVADDGLVVTAKGIASVLRLAKEDLRPSWAEILHGHTELSNWIKTAMLIGTAILAVLSRLKVVRLEGAGD